MSDKVYFDALGINVSNPSPADHARLLEAYNRAHDIRKFEIEMYWRRSAYLWTLQAAAFGGLAAIFATSDVVAWECLADKVEAIGECRTQKMRFIVISAVWAFGLTSSIVWIMLLRGAKFWQNNWERHLDYLESFFSGNLYKTYPTKNLTPPYSVSKVNLAMAIFVMLLWITIGIFSASSTLGIFWPILAIPAVFMVFFFLWLFDSDLRMSDFGNVSSDIKTSRGHWIVRR